MIILYNMICIMNENTNNLQHHVILLLLLLRNIKVHTTLPHNMTHPLKIHNTHAFIYANHTITRYLEDFSNLKPILMYKKV